LHITSLLDLRAALPAAGDREKRRLAYFLVGIRADRVLSQLFFQPFNRCPCGAVGFFRSLARRDPPGRACGSRAFCVCLHPSLHGWKWPRRAFPDERDDGVQMAAIPKLDEANLQAICDILGATDTGLTGSEIGRYLRECACPDPIPQMTKRHRLYAALLEKQNVDWCTNNCHISTYRGTSFAIAILHSKRWWTSLA